MERSLFRIINLVCVLALALGFASAAPPLTLADSEPEPAGEVHALFAPDAVNNNPDLQPGCGIRVALVLDASGSINTTEQGQVRSAAAAFLAALSGTGSRVAIVEFATLGDVPVAYTEVTPASIAAGGVFANYLSTNFAIAGPQYYDGRDSVDNGGTAWTNWHYAFYLVNGLTPPDLVVFVTDGQPTAYGGPGTGVALATNVSAATALPYAETAANTTKGNSGNGGLGSHIFGVGVGMTEGAGGGEGNLWRVLDDGEAAGNLRYPTETTNIAQADYVITTDFSGLQAALTAIVTELCKSSLTVIKKADNDGRGGAYYLEQAGFTFTGNLTVSPGSYTWLSPATVVPPSGRSGVSGANGQVFFQWQISDPSATANITVAETPQDDWVFVDTTCVGSGTLQPGAGTTFTVNGLGKLDSATCTVRNRRLLDFGDAPDSYGTTLAANGARHMKCSATPIYMGAIAPDFENDGQPNATATGDDLAGVDDEDGITMPLNWAPGTQAFTIQANAAACVNVWMDVNRDGDFVDAADWLVANRPVTSGFNTVTFTAPPGLVGQPSYFLRFRITPPDPTGGCGGAAAYGGAAGPLGVAQCGEVTDQIVYLTPLAVSVASFTAEREAAGVLLAWETVSEHGNAGFNVYRAEAEAGPRARLNAVLIPAATPGSSEGHAYQWLDETAAAGQGYWYWLEAVGLQGEAETVGALSVGSPDARPKRLWLPLMSW